MRRVSQARVKHVPTTPRLVRGLLTGWTHPLYLI